MLIHRVNVRDPQMMSIAACIVGMQRVGTRRTVVAVILIASDSASTQKAQNEYCCFCAFLWLKISGPEAQGAVVAAGDEAGVVGQE